jgi:hypothetical protein
MRTWTTLQLFVSQLHFVHQDQKVLPPEQEPKVEEIFVPFPKWISASAWINVECFDFAAKAE